MGIDTTWWRCWWGRGGSGSEVEVRRVFRCGECLLATVVMEVARGVQQPSAVFHRINVTGKRRLRFNYYANLRFNRACAPDAPQWDGRGIARNPSGGGGGEKWIGKMASEIIAMELPPTSLYVVQASSRNDRFQIAGSIGPNRSTAPRRFASLISICLRDIWFSA